ncbi:MAG: homogentisate 1,2-dioxygenase [Acidimicrobiales bacterium]
MAHYRCAGEIPRKRHSRFTNPAGGLYAEELMGSEGFSSSSSLLYHRHAPTAIVAAAAVAEAPQCLSPNHPLLPRHLRAHDLPPGGDLVTGRRLLLGNDDVRILYAAADAASGLYRNAGGDELVYIESGAGTFESVFGTISVAAGDYVVIPASTTHRWLPRAEKSLRALILETTGHVRAPRRYLSDEGQFLEQAPYSERDIRPPVPAAPVEVGEAEVLVRQPAGLTRYTYLHHPFDVVGWDGCLYPYALSIHDFEPLVKRFHAPPPVHQTFEAPRVVVCSFCPRPLDFDPDAVAVPYNHANVDSDEVLFYAGGDFLSRRGSGIGQGSVSLHPAGFIHGPQPGSVEASLGRLTTEELAVMVDTFRPLSLARAAAEVEDRDYPWTWAGHR